MPKQKMIYRLTLALVSLLAAIVFAQQESGKVVAGPKPSASSDPMPKGIYALVPWDSVPQPETWKNPCLEGVVIRMLWSKLNPKRDGYEWGRLDEVFTKAEVYGKKIHLMIAPGFFAPPFVFADAQVDTAHFKLPEDYDKDHPPMKGDLQAMPLPWNEAYLNYWFAFVDKLAQKFGRQKELVYVSVTGPNSHNGEVNLPREESDLKHWLELVDSPRDVEYKEEVLKAKLLAAYKLTIEHFDKAFAPHGKYFTLALPQQSLPIKLKPDNAALQLSYQAELAAYGASNHPKYFGLQNNGLSGRALGDPFQQWPPVREYAGKILTGFQTRAPHNLYDTDGNDVIEDKEDAPAAHIKVMRNTLLNGIRYGGRFIEIYEKDTNDPNLKGVIAAAAKLLSGEEIGCNCE